MQFCQNEVDFAELNVNHEDITPLNQFYLSYFHALTDLTRTGSLFGLVSNVPWAYSIILLMEPSRYLIGPNPIFCWNKQVTESFEPSKQEILC